eukprot:2076179-Amphidinium_carterae.2
MEFFPSYIGALTRHLLHQVRSSDSCNDSMGAQYERTSSAVKFAILCSGNGFLSGPAEDADAASDVRFCFFGLGPDCSLCDLARAR